MTWEPLPDQLFGGHTWFLRGLPNLEDCATCYTPKGQRPKAIAYVSRRFLCVRAATEAEAMARMDRKIAKLLKSEP